MPANYKTVYRYDDETLEYKNEVKVQENPKRPGEFLIPPTNTMESEPKPANTNQTNIANETRDDWIVVPDYRDKEYYLPDGSHHKIENIGEELPEDALNEPPPPTEEEILQQEYQKWKSSRQEAVSNIVVEIDGLKFDGDEISQERMTRVIILADDPQATINWILADNTTAEVTVEQLKRAAYTAGIAMEQLWMPPEQFIGIGS